MTNTFKKSLLIVMACLGTGFIYGAGTNPKTIDDGVQYFSAYKEAKTNLSSNDWVSTSGSPGNSGTSYTAPSGWLDGGSNQPGYGLMNVQKEKTVTFTVTNITSVAILGAANNNTRTLNLSVKDGGNEVGSVATTTGNSIQVLEYASSLEKSKTYSITVSASDGNNAKFYQIRFNGNGTSGGGGSTTPTVSSVVIDPTSATLEPNDTKQLTATVTASPDNADNKKVTWSSDKTGVATVDENGLVTAVAQGTATITATSTIDNTKKATCTITVNAPAQQIPATGVSLNKTSTTIGVGATETLTVSFSPAGANTGKEVTWASDNAAVTVDNNGTIKGVTAGGSANVTVSLNSDPTKKATCAVTVKEAAPIPQTNLTCHEPGIYEEKTVAGGYGGTLSVVGGREYETYYASFLESGALSVTITPVQKSEGITTSLSDYNCKAKDGWFEMKTSTSKSNYSLGAKDEFKAGEAAIHKLLNNAYYKMHIKGFDQFSFYGKDNTADESKGKHFEVYIDNIKQSMTTATSASIRRFDMTSGEHLIEVRGVGASNNEFYAFSLRVSDQPRTRWIKGNDSTQTILQTQAPKAVYYYTKYNSKGETKLEWDGAEATGISLSVKGSTDIGDTLVLGGVANCPTGDYKYNVVTYMNGQETSRASGKFKVMSDIKVKSESTTVDAYQQEEMEEIEFRYYALDASAITLSWENDNAPAGITTSDDATEHIFTISGTPTAPQGDYPFSVTIAGSETVITGVIKVWSSDLGENPVLYLYKTKGEKSAYDNDGIYEYLKSKDVNLIPRTAIKKLRSADQYAKFKWILISEDVDADNEEVLEIIKGGSGLPVLNLKGFTYTADRLGWGEPDNGTLDTISNNGCNIFIEREDHPIFESFNLKHGAKLQIFNKLQPNSNGVMPINIDLPGSLCLATAYTRNIEYYYQDGELQTVIHEIPADQREGKKYICVPLAMSNSKNLSADGKKLFNEIVKYLMDDTEYPVSQRTLKINSFRVNNLDATIKEDRIDLVYDTIQHPEMNIKALAPEIALEDELTHVTPASGDTIDFTYSLYMPVVYVVTDFINRHVYEVVIQAYGSQGLEEITYTVGEWVNIYDIYGRLIATTNENIHTMNLPRGMYIAVTENGKSIKLMK